MQLISYFCQSLRRDKKYGKDEIGNDFRKKKRSLTFTYKTLAFDVAFTTCHCDKQTFSALSLTFKVTATTGRDVIAIDLKFPYTFFKTKLLILKHYKI